MYIGLETCYSYGSLRKKSGITAKLRTYHTICSLFHTIVPLLLLQVGVFQIIALSYAYSYISPIKTFAMYKTC